MASLLCILDSRGAPLIVRSYRGDFSQSITQVFTRRVLEEEESLITPIFEHDGHTYMWIRHNNVFFLTVSKINCIPALFFVFMRRCIDVFSGYFNLVTEESVRDNFVIIYELLDEMMDFGYPQYTEAKVLKEYITQEGYLLQLFEEDQLQVKALPSAVTGVGGATPWRRPGIKYRRNEAFLDVVEAINLLVSQDGEVLSSEILGTLKMKVQLSGMPELKLGLNDRIFFDIHGIQQGRKKTVDLEDIRFHQCVRLNRYESDRTISFIPPDGEFDLMNYRLATRVRALIQIETQVMRHGSSRVEMVVKARANYKKSTVANFVVIGIPVPVDADVTEAKANNGIVKYTPEQECLSWTLLSFAGAKEGICRCQYTLPSIRITESSALSKRPVTVKFEIPYFTMSGVQVRYLKVTEKSNYEAMPWVRYITKSGDYQIRTG